MTQSARVANIESKGEYKELFYQHCNEARVRSGLPPTDDIPKQEALLYQTAFELYHTVVKKHPVKKGRKGRKENTEEDKKEEEDKEENKNITKADGLKQPENIDEVEYKKIKPPHKNDDPNGYYSELEAYFDNTYCAISGNTKQ